MSASEPRIVDSHGQTLAPGSGANTGSATPSTAVPRPAGGAAGGAGGTFGVKTGLAQMLKGGVIMDVMNVEQAKIAEEAGAAAVMALERIPANIRRDGGVARMVSLSAIGEPAIGPRAGYRSLLRAL
ncbi:hypothetical protein A1Q1_05005 [Trichosporon asahii var. asahii CBS 2479]|uniref:PdxS/SNZ N-terminal domain-containing protein n=1 Tax=Trichosporon asahii var. asahii (strain ATCC 90039 / CBS 2479 / JCM 2466 / KCTC 7840 / NBRC 103889/ NCYC 2677 / UAMH 7654) TaxID=1186058 RepID=J5QAK6_TRIAS|nr:hypothetical protein A1Q1_05005 [Trichosporon asahii var. asahii CBS 2479]EJT46358.1 hypothetical protein A1Q1_05005 [Trichosporon asahii var. asahii CBS 2479]